MYKPLRFRDWFSKTSLSGFKTMFFCATNDFIIPHDVAGAILYGEALAGADEVTFDASFLKNITPSLVTFVSEAQSYLNALNSMGYQDIVEEFNRHNMEVFDFVKEHYATKPYNTDEVVKKIESLVKPEYMAIIKQHQK